MQIWTNGIMMGVRTQEEAKEYANNMRAAGWYVTENSNYVSAERGAPLISGMSERKKRKN